MCLKQNITQKTKKEDWLKIKVEINKPVSLKMRKNQFCKRPIKSIDFLTIWPQDKKKYHKQY